MSAFDLFCMRFALATIASLAAGGAVWAVLALCRRWLPALALQRSVCLLGQLAIVATFVLVLVPQTAPLRAVPAIDVNEVAASTVARVGAAPLAAAVPATALAPAIDWLLRAAQLWLLVYGVGISTALARQWRNQRTLDLLARAGVRLGPRECYAGIQAGAALAVFEVDAAISPMLVGLFQPRLLLPRHLRDFPATQQGLIVSHELTHWRRRDLHWLAAALALQTLLWFHPAMRLLRAQLSWAQELACDRDVLDGRPQAERKDYAGALLAQFKTQRCHGAMLAFAGASVSSGASLAARIGLIRAPLTAGQGRRSRSLALLALAAVFIGNLSLQPALAWHAAPLPLPLLLPLSAPANNTASGALDCTLIVDAASGRTLQRDGDCDTRITPASTFNIPVSLMGFDSGLLHDAHTPLLPYRPSYVSWNPEWRRATDPTSWIKNSTVWYAQLVTGKLGAARLARYLDGFSYGNRDASGDRGRNNGLTMSWISSSMQISPSEQAAFLRHLVNRNLPVSAQAVDLTAQLLQLPAQDGWQVYGKTGTASPVLANGQADPARSYGWFVGWATKGTRTLVFARLLLDQKRPGRAAGPLVKQAFLDGLPARLDAL
ncbi:class D beta-lactamase [Massilia sp. PWRC2]|uniref:class D beta-lactamase n=1 Tax=Massilia sp. PWRC2 TaxID=2804626 RepID=UPI003CEF1ACD